jgi:hypothetical protein
VNKQVRLPERDGVRARLNSRAKASAWTGLEHDSETIRSDSSSIPFDSGVLNDANAPIDRV